jgi:hypothetical protein
MTIAVARRLERAELTRNSEIVNDIPKNRMEIVTKGDVFDAVLKLRSYLEYPASYPDVEIFYSMDTPKPRTRWLIRLHG